MLVCRVYSCTIKWVINGIVLKHHCMTPLWSSIFPTSTSPNQDASGSLRRWMATCMAAARGEIPRPGHGSAVPLLGWGCNHSKLVKVSLVDYPMSCLENSKGEWMRWKNTQLIKCWLKKEFEVGEVKEREVVQVRVLKAYSSKLGCQKGPPKTRAFAVWVGSVFGPTILCHPNE